MAEVLRRLPAAELPGAAWGFAAGAAVAEKTRVLGYDEASSAKLLTVEVPDATWRAQLAAMTPQFLARLNLYLAVSGIEFKVAGAPAHSGPAAPAAPHKRTPRKSNA
jgi:hypothetical protein